MRAIDADALISDLAYDVKMDEDSLIYEDLTNENREIIQFDKDCKQNAIDLLRHAPTIEERKTGKWIDRGYMKVGFHCSECGGYSIDGKDKFCPNCGAKMEVSK